MARSLHRRSRSNFPPANRAESHRFAESNDSVPPPHSRLARRRASCSCLLFSVTRRAQRRGVCCDVKARRSALFARCSLAERPELLRTPMLFFAAVRQREYELRSKASLTSGHFVIEVPSSGSRRRLLESSNRRKQLAAWIVSFGGHCVINVIGSPPTFTVCT